MKLSSFLPAILAASASAQSTTAFTDSTTNITYQAYTNGNFLFGVALDTAATSTDFIGLIVGKGTGYVGISLGGSMVNNLLVAAWPNAKTIISSFRKTAAIMSPAVATGAYSMVPISKGTYVNATHFSYTFLCKSCILSDGTTFTANSTGTALGWAYSPTAPVTPASADTKFSKHASQGNFGADYAAAKNAAFKTWASMASKPMKRSEFYA